MNRNSLLKRKEGIENSNRNCFVVDYHKYIHIYMYKYPVLNHINRVLNTVVERVEKKKRQT